MITEEHRWIGDHRSVGRVDWPSGLRDSITAGKRRAMRKMLKWIATPPALVLLAVAVGVISNPFMSRQTSDRVLIAIIFLIGIVLIIAILRANDFHKEVVRAHAALECQRPERFELAEHVHEETAAAKALGLAASLDGIARVLYVDPRSSLVLQADDIPLLKLEPVIIHSIARPRTQPPKTTPSTSTVTPSSTSVQPLEPAETDELRRYVLDGTRHAKWLFLLIYFWLSVGFGTWWYRLIAGLAVLREDWSFVVIVTVLWLLATYALLGPMRTQLRTRKLMRKDLRAGLLEVVTGHTAVADLRASGVPDAQLPQVNPGVVRRLPNSGIWWEIDGVPASWRRI